MEVSADPSQFAPEEPQDPKPQPSPEAMAFAASQKTAVPQEPQQTATEPSPEARQFVADRTTRAENDFLTQFAIASETDPSRYAEARDMAKTLGISPETALEPGSEDGRKVLRAVWKKRNLEAADLANTSPILAQQFMDAEFARLAHDDVANLGFFEGLWKSFTAGRAETELSKIGAERMFHGDSDQLLAQARNLRRELRHSPPSEGWVWGPARWLGQMSVQLPEAVNTGSTMAVGVGLMSAPFGPEAAVPAMATAFATGFAGSMFKQSFELQGGLDYDQFIQAGYDPKAAFHAALGSGLTSAFLESAGVAVQWARPLMGPLKNLLARQTAEALTERTLSKAGLSIGKSWLIGALGETASEDLQEIASMVAEHAAYRQTKDGPNVDPSSIAKGEAWQRLVDTSVSIAQLSLVLGTIPEYGRFRYLASQADRAAAVKDTLARSMGTAEESKTLERAPDVATAYLAKVLKQSKADTLYIDGQAFAEVLRQSDKESVDAGKLEKSAAEQLNEKFPEIAGQINDAIATNGDVAIPTAQFIEKLSKTAIGDKLIEHARVSEKDPSFAETREAIDNADEIVKKLDQDVDKRADEAEKFAESAAKLERRVRDEIAATGRVKNRRVTDATALVVRRYYETQAADQGKLPHELPAIRFSGQPAPEGAQAQPGRGAYDPNTNTIHLTETTDPSTLWHELVHSFFSMMLADPAPTVQTQQNLDTIFKWFGVTREQWDALSTEQRTKLHEQLAVNHEIYGHEGKAPTVELQPVFDRFSRWIRDVYGDVNGKLNALYRKEFGVDLPVLTDEVRQTFGRLLAAQDTIDKAAAVNGSTAVFSTRESFPGTEEQWNEYRALEEARRLGSISKLSAAYLADLKWLQGRKAFLEKQVAEEVRKARSTVGASAKKQVEQEPIYRLRTALKTNRMKFDRAEASRALGVLAHDRMAALEPYLSDDGALPDVVANRYGFRSAEEMLTALTDAPTLADAIEARTDELMIQEHGSIRDATDQALAVEEALNNEATSRLAGFLLKWALGEKRQGRLTAAALKETARRRLENTAVRKISASAYSRAAAKSEREAAELLRGKRASTSKEGESRPASAPAPREAIAKLQQWALNTELARQAAKIEREVTKAKTSAERFFRPDERLAKTRSMNLVNAGRAILTAYGIVNRAKLPLAYIKAIEAYDPVSYDRLAPLVDEVTKNDTLQDYRDLTLEQFRDVVGIVDALWDSAAHDKFVEAEGQKVLRVVAEDEMLAAATAALGPAARAVGPVTDTERDALSWSGIKASLRRVESWARMMDGNKASGPWQKYVFRQMSVPFTKFMADRERLVKQMHDLLLKLPMPVGEIDATADLGHTFQNMAELLGALIHTGNRSSMRKLLLGYNWGTESVTSGTPVLDRSRWDSFIAKQVQKGTLQKVHFDFVQAMWDLNEQLKPIAQAVNKELYDVYFKEIEAEPFSTPFGDYRGGYAPAPPDPAHPKNAELAIKTETDFLTSMENDFRQSMPGVNESFTMDRNESTRPLLLDVRMQARHFDQVLRFIHLQRPARDVMRIITSERMGAYLESVQPGAVKKMLIPWLEATTANRMTTPGDGGKLDAFFSTLRRTTGLRFMFGSLRNAAQQFTGILNSLVYVKARHLKAGFWRYLEMGGDKALAHVSEQSQFMKERLTSQFGQLQDDIDLILDPSRMGRIKQFTNKHGYFMQRYTQGRVDLITWLGARDQALAEHGDMARAVQEADSAVRLTQGSHTPVDAAKYERGTPFNRLFFQFSGYYNVVLNQFLNETGWQKKAKTALLASVAPAFAAAAIGSLLGGLTDFDDNDGDGYGDEIAWWMASTQTRALANIIPGFGPAVAQMFTSEKVAGDRVTLAPAASVIQAAARLIGVFEYQPRVPNASQVEVLGQRFRAGGSQIRDLSAVLSTLTGLPLDVLAKPLAYWRDVATGETEATPLRTIANILGTGR